jgi:hypothetical protein
VILFLRGSRHPRVWLLLRQVHADADDILEERPVDELALHELPLALRQVADRRRPGEHVLEDLQLDRRLVVRGRYEDALSGIDLQPEDRRRIQVREEQQHVVFLLVAPQVLDEPRTPRALLLQPLHLVVAAVRVVIDPVRVLVERVEVARRGVGEPADGHAADPVGPLGVLVLPRLVVARARREDLDLVLCGEALGHEPAQVLGSAENLGAVPLDDDS